MHDALPDALARWEACLNPFLGGWGSFSCLSSPFNRFIAFLSVFAFPSGGLDIEVLVLYLY